MRDSFPSTHTFRPHFSWVISVPPPPTLCHIYFPNGFVYKNILLYPENKIFKLLYFCCYSRLLIFKTQPHILSAPHVTCFCQFLIINHIFIRVSSHQRAKANITQCVILHEPCLSPHAREGAGAAASLVFYSETIGRGTCPEK